MLKGNKTIDTFQKYVYIIGGSIALLLLGIILIKNITYKQKDIIIHSLIIIVYSEMLNSMIRIINIFKFDKKTEICQIQKYIGIYSDICTPLANIFLSREIYHFVKYNESSSFALKPSYLIYIYTFIIPFLLTILLILLENIILKKNKNEEKIYVCYINDNLIFVVIIIILILLIITCVYSLKTFLNKKKKKKEYKELEEELNSDNEYIINNNNENYEKIKKKLNKVHNQMIKFSICILLVWMVLIFIRTFHYIKTYNKNEDEEDEFLKNLFRFHCVLSTCRGIFFYFVYSNEQIFSFKNEKNKKQNNMQLIPELKNQNSENLNNENKSKIDNEYENEPYKPDDDEKISDMILK